MSAYNNLSIKELKDTQKELSLRLNEINKELDHRTNEEARSLEQELYDIFRKIGNRGFEINIVKDLEWGTDTMTFSVDDLKEGKYSFEISPDD